jgi:hypothetical protein
MTEPRASGAAGAGPPSAAGAGPPSAAGAGPPIRERTAPRRAPKPRRRWRSLLAVLAGALACFLAILVLLTVRLTGGVNPATHAVAPVAGLVTHRGQSVLRTTASGRVIGVEGGEGAASAGSVPARLATRASGASGSERSDD